MSARRNRVASLKTTKKALVEEDIRRAGEEMLRGRKPASNAMSDKGKESILPPADLQCASENSSAQKQQVTQMPKQMTEKREEKQLTEEKEGAEEEDSYFGMDRESLLKMDKVLKLLVIDEQKTKELCTDGAESEAGRQVIKLLQEDDPKMDVSTAKGLLSRWVEAQDSAREDREKKDDEAATKQKQEALLDESIVLRRPIIQCQMCKSTGFYWAPCWVAPMVIGYDYLDAEGKVVKTTRN